MAIECLAKDVLMYRKVCALCKRMLPGTSKYFASHKRTRDGLFYICRDCGNQKRLELQKKTVKESKKLDYVEPMENLDFFEDLNKLDYRESAYD